MSEGIESILDAREAVSDDEGMGMCISYFCSIFSAASISFSLVLFSLVGYCMVLQMCNKDLVMWY